MDINTVGSTLGGKTMTVTVTDDTITEWLPGQTVQFTLTNAGLNDDLTAGDNALKLTVSVTSTATGYTGTDMLREDVRIVKP